MKKPITAVELMRRAMSRAPSIPYREVLRRDPCVYCVVWPMPGWATSQITMEHIDPKSKGGKEGWKNLAAAHAACNWHRSDRPLLPYMLYRFRLTGLHGPKFRKERKRLKQELAPLWGEKQNAD